jgi:hypothetical protein
MLYPGLAVISRKTASGQRSAAQGELARCRKARLAEVASRMAQTPQLFRYDDRTIQIGHRGRKARS